MDIGCIFLTIEKAIVKRFIDSLDSALHYNCSSCVA